MKKYLVAIALLSVSIVSPLQSASGCSSEPCVQLKRALLNESGKYGYSLKESEQIVVVRQTRDAHHGTVSLLERTAAGEWVEAAAALPAELGRNGIAAHGEKVEGDGKTPSGFYPLSLVFGYGDRAETAMPYRQAAERDFWIDDPDHRDYNRWVQDPAGAKSFEQLRRKDDLYKLAIVVEYNVNPVVKGKGSAIFFHIWRDEEKPTAGCVALSEENLTKIVKWLEPQKRPLVLILQRETDLADIRAINSRIAVDIRYAKADNFAKRTLYDSDRCVLRKSTAAKLDAVQKELEKRQLGLKVWDCYRPLSVQKILWAILPDERYVANPFKGGSRHNRGTAVDLTLVDEQGKELSMPTAFDDFSPKAGHNYSDLPAEAIRNRGLLKDAMKKAGFIPLPDEWWHYDDENWKAYELLDFSLSDVAR